MDETTSGGGASASANMSRHNSSDRFVISQCRRSTEVSAGSNATAANQETSEESEQEERVLVVNCRSGKLGAAYYTLQTAELFVTEEVVDVAPGHAMFGALLAQVQPAVLLMDRGQPAALQQAARAALRASGEQGHCKLLTLSARDYNFEACKRRIFSLSLPSEPRGCSSPERALFLRTVLDLSQARTVHALGALLRYLDLHWATLAMERELSDKPQFLSLRKVSLADIVMIDWDTYLGLQVFRPIGHPSGFRAGAREGLSLLQLYSRCSSTISHNRMRVLMQHPSSDVPLLTRRQQVIQHCLLPASEPLLKNLTASLRHIRNVNGILAKIQALSAKPSQWKSLYNTLYHAVLISELCESASSVPLLQELASFPTTALYEAALAMHRLIDFDLCAAEGKFTVRAGVDPELDMKKQTMASLQGLMGQTAAVELSRLPPQVQECSMVYLPHLGYLLAVKAWDQDLTPEQRELPDCRFMNNDYIHYKTKGCEELDLMIGDTYPEIVAHETRLMMRLTERLIPNLTTLADLIDKCAELDCLIAMSHVAREFSFVRPTLTQEKEIRIVGGRHPLLAPACDAFVPNDYHSTADQGLVKIITGPNASGKSVYIKQIGLIVFLAHIGSFVPAAEATIGVVRAIHSRLHSTESVANHMSAFLIDLRQMALGLQQCGPRSLLLVDEFGKGSVAADGRALLAAVTNSVLCRPDSCPHLVLATHYLNLRPLLLDTPLLRFIRFEHMFPPDCNSPVFLFRATEGASDCSLALRVASGCGLPDDVIRRATAVHDSLMNNSLPPANKKIVTKLNSCTEIIAKELLSEDI